MNFYITLGTDERKDSAAGDVPAVMGEAPKTHTAFRLSTVSRAEAQTAEKVAIWHSKHDSHFIPGKQELEKIQTVNGLLDYALKKMG